MSTFYPCLWFDGTAEEAAEFYASLLPVLDAIAASKSSVKR